MSGTIGHLCSCVTHSARPNASWQKSVIDPTDRYSCTALSPTSISSMNNRALSYVPGNGPLNPEKSTSTDLIIAPPQVADSAFLKRFQPTELAMASGWMQVRGVRRRSTINQGFVVSDHADWDGLIRTVKDSGASQVYATHGETRVFTRY